MTRPLPPEIATIAAAVVEADSAWLFLDYDGTLAPIAPTPDEADPLPGVADLVAGLARRPTLHVAIVTGRPIANVRRFIDLAEIHYVGLHGVERQAPRSPMSVAPQATALREALPRLSRHLAARVAGRAGVMLEDKGAALACHYRLASRADAADAKRSVEEVAAEYRATGGEVSVLHGHEVSELRPVGIDKGAAVLELVRAQPAEALVYVGDDATDEDAFARLPEDALTIRVAATEVPTRARYRASSPAEVKALLEAIEQIAPSDGSRDPVVRPPALSR